MERMSLSDQIAYTQLNVAMLAEAAAENAAAQQKFTSRRLTVPSRLIYKEQGIRLQTEYHQRQLQWLESKKTQREDEAQRVVKLTLGELNGNGQEIPREIKACKAEKSERDARIRASMRGHNAAPPKHGFRRGRVA